MAAGGVNVPLGVNSGEVMLPCEFCEDLFPSSDIIRHQSGCDCQAVHHSRFFTKCSMEDAKQSSPNIQDYKMCTERVSSIRIEQSHPHDVFYIDKRNDGSYLLKTAQGSLNEERILSDSIQETEEVFENDGSYLLETAQGSLKEEHILSDSIQETEEVFKVSENYELSDDDNEENEYIEHFVHNARLAAKSQDRNYMKFSRGMGV